jgi:hypothetical protein
MVNKDYLRGVRHRQTIIAWALLFASGAAVALLLTFGGLHWLLEQVTAAQNAKSSTVAAILALGPVLIGPVLLLALAAVLPRWWFHAVKIMFRRLFARPHLSRGRPQRTLHVPARVVRPLAAHSYAFKAWILPDQCGCRSFPCRCIAARANWAWTFNQGWEMKRSLLTGFRAMAFALGAFALLAVTGNIKIHRTLDVTIFVLGLAIFWFLIERVFLNVKQKQRKTP